MQTGSLDRRSALMLAAGVAAILIVRFVFFADSSSSASAIASAETIPAAEKRLEKVRQINATVPGKEELFKQIQIELAEREKGVLKADTEDQAKAQLLEVIQGIGRANSIDIRTVQEFRDARLSADYGEIWITVPFSCSIEQLVNFLAALGDQPLILATRDIHVSGGNDKNKLIQVHLSVSAIVPLKLIPKKGTNTL